MIAMALLACTSSARADITVQAPLNGATVDTPVLVQATSTGCNGDASVSFGYSVDNSTTTTMSASATSINVSDSTIAAGAHTLHFKSWTSAGICPTVESSITVVDAPDIVVQSPLNGATVDMPVVMQATSNGCGGAAPVSFGYSVDDSATTHLSTSATTMNISDDTIATGSHVINFKTWTNNGICPVVSNSITVSAQTYTSLSGNLTPSSKWIFVRDTGSGGKTASTTANMVYPVTSPSMDNEAREFNVSHYTDYAGQRASISFLNSDTPTHYVYDTYVYIPTASLPQIENIEMDMNHTLANGETVILGTQCAHASKTFEYTFVGTVNGTYGTHWAPSNITCDPEALKGDTWHHFQIATEHDASGNVTYDWVRIDGGPMQSFQNGSGGALTVASQESLGWTKGGLLLNFQLDGSSSGSGAFTAYIDELQVLTW